MYNKHDLCKPNVQGIWLVYCCHGLEPLTHCLRQTNTKQPPTEWRSGCQAARRAHFPRREEASGGCGWGVQVGGAARPAPPAPGSGAWLQPGLTFQVSLAGDQSARATNTAQNSEAPRPPPSPVPPHRLPHTPQPLPPPGGAAFGGGRGRAPIRPPLTPARRPGPSHPEKVLLAIIEVIKPPKSPVGCWF